MSSTKRLVVFGLTVAVITLVGIVLILMESQPWVAVGTSLVASGIVGMLEVVYRYLVTNVESPGATIVRAGLDAAYSHRDLDRYHSLMSSLSSCLDISGYSLRNFYDSFRDTLLAAAAKNPSLRVRFLLVDPTTTHSREREALEGHATGTFVAAVARIVADVKEFKNISVLTTKAPITTMVFRIDNTMFVGPQFCSVPSKAAPTFELSSGKNAWLFRAYEREFASMCDSASDAQEGRESA